VARLLLIVVCLLFAGCATTNAADDFAKAGMAADLGTTAMGIGAAGMVEANPLGLALIPLKFGVANYIAGIEDSRERNAATTAFAATQWGAAGWNLCLIAGAVLPAAAACGAGAAFAAHQHAKSQIVTLAIDDACVQKHMPALLRAAHEKREYRINLASCAELLSTDDRRSRP